MNITVQPINIEDNSEIKKVIQTVFIEHGINRPGTAFFDPCLEDMYSHHTGERKKYFVAKEGGVVIGGAGIFPTEGLEKDTCELVKMYLLQECRGKGVGRMLIEKCIKEAKKMGYTKMYLETTPELASAISMYEKFDFKYLQERMGNTGHHSCGTFMLKEL